MGDFVPRRPCCNTPSLLPDGTITMKKITFLFFNLSFNVFILTPSQLRDDNV
jgi:hypothetical protein